MLGRIDNDTQPRVGTRWGELGGLLSPAAIGAFQCEALPNAKALQLTERRFPPERFVALRGLLLRENVELE